MSIFNNFVTGPGWPGNAQQPNTDNPKPKPGIADFPTGTDVLRLGYVAPPNPTDAATSSYNNPTTGVQSPRGILRPLCVYD